MNNFTHMTPDSPDENYVDPLNPGQQVSGSLQSLDQQGQPSGSYYTFADDQPGQQPTGQYSDLNQPSSMYAQVGQSGPLPTVGDGNNAGGAGNGGKKRSLFTRSHLITVAAVILLVIAGTAYAQSGHSLLRSRGASSGTTTAGTTTAQHNPASGQSMGKTPAVTKTPSPVTAKASPSPPSPVTAQPTATIPVPATLLKLPAAWGPHSQLDAIEAATTALTFTQREMTIDFRSAGTLTAAKFILTANGRARFNANDKRSSAAFAASVQQQQLIEAPVFSAIPQIVQAQTQGQRFFAWAVVSFPLMVQHGANGTPALEMNPQANQPMVHQMVVLLVSVPFNGPQMGGIGWEVSDYALDQAGGLPPIPVHP